MQWLACARVNVDRRTCMLTVGAVVVCVCSCSCRAHRTLVRSDHSTSGHSLSAAPTSNRVVSMADRQLDVCVASATCPSRTDNGQFCGQIAALAARVKLPWVATA